MEQRSYSEGMDRSFFASKSVEVEKYQEWQYGLFHVELEGKFVWYPKKGTLMWEREREMRNLGSVYTSEGVYRKMVDAMCNKL